MGNSRQRVAHGGDEKRLPFPANPADIEFARGDEAVDELALADGADDDGGFSIVAWFPTGDAFDVIREELCGDRDDLEIRGVGEDGGGGFFGDERKRGIGSGGAQCEIAADLWDGAGEATGEKKRFAKQAHTFAKSIRARGDECNTSAGLRMRRAMDSV